MPVIGINALAHAYKNHLHHSERHYFVPFFSGNSNLQINILYSFVYMVRWWSSENVVGDASIQHQNLFGKRGRQLYLKYAAIHREFHCLYNNEHIIYIQVYYIL